MNSYDPPAMIYPTPDHRVVTAADTYKSGSSGCPTKLRTGAAIADVMTASCRPVLILLTSVGLISAVGRVASKNFTADFGSGNDFILIQMLHTINVTSRIMTTAVREAEWKEKVVCYYDS
jgi:hypothetical protein